ncbi:MAG: flagellar hook-associated protein FlgL [Candidatus Poribacteria bacterium]
MRVTEHMNFNTVRDTIRRSKERMELLQRQAATLKKLNIPSDDPIGAAKVLEIRTDRVNNQQFHVNGKMAETYLENTDQALSELADIVGRAKEIALGQSSGASANGATRANVAEEVLHLFQQAVSVSNRRIGDRYIFGGYKIDKPPVDVEGNYFGDDGQMMAEIARDVYLSVNVPGVEAFNTDPKSQIKQPSGYWNGLCGPAGDMLELADEPNKENINIFGEVQNLRIALLANDVDGIRNTLERLDDMQSRLVAMRAKVGSRLNGLQNTINSIERQNVVQANLSSSLEDADVAQVVSDLAKEETIFRGALASSQKLIQPTLMDFLK